MKQVILTRQMKIDIGNRIKKHKMPKVEGNSEGVVIPEMKDLSGRPLVLQPVVYNKIWEKVRW